MNGAESLIQTLVDGGVDTCFMNPGTSEIHFVAALDRVPQMRGVPCLFEGAASGAADGYARMSGKPASTLLHLGPGLSNALANLHNACRARMPLINIVGDHATFHRHYETPLASNIEAIARPYSTWLRSSASPEAVGQDCAEAIASAITAPFSISTLILPADTAWGEGGVVGEVPQMPPPSCPADSQIDHAAKLLRSDARVALVLGAVLAVGNALTIAGKIAATTGAALLVPFAFTRLERGAGRPSVKRIAYVTEEAIAQLAEFDAVILAGAPPPVSFFAHPNKPSVLTKETTEVFTLSTPQEDGLAALTALALAVKAEKAQPQVPPLARSALPAGSIDSAGLAAVIGALLPENAIVVDESITSGRGMLAATASAPPHDWLVNTGGSIGIALPLSVGAAVACPGRPVLCLEADGSGLYTLQALWTAARENLAITAVIFANRSYAILKGELGSAAANPGPRALEMLQIDRPEIDWVSLARGFGVFGTKVETLEEFAVALRRGFESRAPNLIEVVLP
ncbi:MAG: acetolactate synthase large subunit [Alphaproteobacteria bacterium]|nr:acetolactate synthase large subunit [Alphaproteobacteria bacterium]